LAIKLDGKAGQIRIDLPENAAVGHYRFQMVLVYKGNGTWVEDGITLNACEGIPAPALSPKPAEGFKAPFGLTVQGFTLGVCLLGFGLFILALKVRPWLEEREQEKIREERRKGVGPNGRDCAQFPTPWEEDDEQD
jgi:hypothetical protein